MSKEAMKIGQVGWFDLTVADADVIRDFYQDVVGWTSTGLSMGDYDDFCMSPPGEENPVAGICHARGINAKVPPVWLMYVNVNDLETSLAKVVARGGEVVDGPRTMGAFGRFAAIRDPAGAVMALFQPNSA